MPKADLMLTITRRAALAGGAIVLPSGTGAPTSTADEFVFDISRRLGDIERQFKAARADDEFDVLIDRQNHLLDVLSLGRATTPEGMRAKAAVALLMFRRRGSNWFAELGHDERMIASIAFDLSYQARS